MTGPLAPSLGRLGRPTTAARWEPIRMAMVDALVSARAAGQLDGAAWLAAWSEAVTRLRDQLLEEGRARLERAAVRSRMPSAALAELQPSAEAAERLLQRLLAEGMPLEVLEPAAVDAATDRRRGAALEAAWEGAVGVATAEAARYRLLAERTLAWRRPWRPLVMAGAAITIVALVIAAMIGGLVPAPDWFVPVIDWFWSWPWP